MIGIALAHLSVLIAVSASPLGLAFEFRKWTSVNGQSIEARIDGLGEDSVRLVTKSNKVFTVRFDILVREDQAYVASWRETRGEILSRMDAMESGRLPGVEMSTTYRALRPEETDRKDRRLFDPDDEAMTDVGARDYEPPRRKQRWWTNGNGTKTTETTVGDPEGGGRMSWKSWTDSEGNITKEIKYEPEWE